MPDAPRQGELWLVNFQEGWERPAVVVSRQELNRGRLVLVVPCTSSRVAERGRFANHVLLTRGVAGLDTDSVAQAHLIQPVEVSMLLRRLGVLDDEQLAEILLAVAWVLDLFDTTGSAQTGP